VLRAVGVQGEVLVHLHAQAPAAHHQAHRLYVDGQPRAVERARPRKGAIVLKLRGVDNPEQASALRGAMVAVPQALLAPTPEDTYYHSQVLGLRVVTTDGRNLGAVTEILETPANDVYVVTDQDHGEVLVPAIADVVKSVDVARGVMVVEPVPGLLDGPQREL
jgi:16S rRNA processing protein RimM